MKMKTLLAIVMTMLPLLAFCQPERFALIVCAKSGEQIGRAHV